jgi:putative DNA primase/helicase
MENGAMIIEAPELKQAVTSLAKKPEPIAHKEVLSELLSMVNEVDFRELAGADEDEKVKASHLQVLVIEELLRLARAQSWGMCKHNSFLYIYNGAFWHLLEKDELISFLGQAAEKMGVPRLNARYYLFRDSIYRQFLATAYLPKPEPQPGVVLINLKNGTFEITSTGTRLRQFNRNDFLTYQLPFEHNPQARAPIFEAYLNRVLPDPGLQKILAEFMGYVFIHPSTLKLEKTLLPYGTGANGKSVLFDVVNALLGSQNVSSYSLSSLTNDSGYFRAMLQNKLLNYASEISGNLETAIFKQLVSGEPVEARLPYQDPFTLTNYAKLIFNCNELPRDVEHTKAYYRRFLIIPFDVVIPEDEQDVQLAQKIIANELPGVFNWVLAGLKRLLQQKKFTESDQVRAALSKYELQSDSVRLYLDENEYKAHPTKYELIKDIYPDYRKFCTEDGFRPVNKINFRKRLEACGIITERIESGNVAYLTNGKGCPYE